MRLLLLISLVIAALSGCSDTITRMQNQSTTDEGGNTSDLLQEKDLADGGPGMDGIPSIDNPEFVSVDEADEWLSDIDQVIALQHNGIKKAYPLPIMVWHEIVNDNVGGDPIAVTYCPLCDSGIAFKRLIDDEAVEFGTSGKLYNSNLVMYDRKTRSYWTQIDGRAVIGERSSDTLNRIPVTVVSWSDYRDTYPDALILSRDTGNRRSYGADPYEQYYTSREIRFPVEHRNDSQHPKTTVYGIHLDDETRAYPAHAIQQGELITENIGQHSIVVNKSDIGEVSISINGEAVAFQRMFWFAWYAFHPQTGVYNGS